MENEIDLNTNKVKLSYGGMNIRLSELMEKLNKAGLLPQPEREGDGKVKYITRYEGQFKLCFISGQFAYFTPKPLEGKRRQWGDDWDDSPYEYNAGKPYDIQYITKVAFDFRGKAEGFDYNFPLGKKVSVQYINQKGCPWIDFPTQKGKHHKNAIWAGDSLNKFIRKVKEMDGEIYTKS